MDLSTNSYSYLIEAFSAERIQSRFDWVKSLLDDYVKQEELQDKVYVSEDVLNHVIVDFFADIHRLKEFHNIETTHESKVYAYLAFWILKRKPIILKQSSEEHVFINEKFVSEFLRSYLFRNPCEVSILDENKPAVDTFLATMEYFFKYREYSAQNIELMLLTFNAGRAYQESVYLRK